VVTAAAEAMAEVATASVPVSTGVAERVAGTKVAAARVAAVVEGGDGGDAGGGGERRRRGRW